MIQQLLPGLIAGVLFGMILIRDWRGRFTEGRTWGRALGHLVARYGILLGAIGAVSVFSLAGVSCFFPGFGLGYFSILFLSAGKSG